jgi:hypothetical protein
LLELLRVEDAGAGRAVGGAERGTIGGDGDGFERLAEDDVEGLARGNRNDRGYVMCGGDFDLLRRLGEGKGAVGGRDG